MIKDVPEDEGLINDGGKELGKYYGEDEGQGTDWDSDGGQEDEGGN